MNWWLFCQLIEYYILVKIYRCLRHVELGRILITEDIYYAVVVFFVCILLKCCKSRNGTVGWVGNKSNDKNWFNHRTGKHYNVN